MGGLDSVQPRLHTYRYCFRLHIPGMIDLPIHGMAFLFALKILTLLQLPIHLPLEYHALRQARNLD